MTYAEISAQRKIYDISQTKLALYGGFSKSLISAWELGKQSPSEEQLKKLNGVMSDLIQKIQTGDIEIKKKKIQHTGYRRTKLPPVIKSREDYAKRFTDIPYASEYAKELQELYRAAKKKKESSMPKGIALFSGCGGMTLGFEAAGFNVVGHVEINDSANHIYAANFQDAELLGHDICSLSDEDIEKWKQKTGTVDIIIGGPPCQGFSLAGKRNPEDRRNKLYRQYVRIVSKLHPKVFVMENVALMTSMRDSDGNLFIDRIIHEFEQEGYSVYTKVVNAQEYGVPQSRERILLVGICGDKAGNFEFPQTEYSSDSKKGKAVRTFRYATYDLMSLENGEASENDPLHWAITHPQHVIEWLRDVPEGHSAHENVKPELRPPSGFNTTYKRIMWDEPCSTISTNFSMISGCRNVHPQNTRALTIREAARAQSFPDEFVFVGNWGEVRKAIGNAVPPILARTLADSIMVQLF
ncbi:MAG: DNA (cytosine-5-)-methyltransferase [Roseburia sp.]|nr:DNA (cytosine-5-)-methyltransferase [Roseburia sp.]